MPAVWRSVLGTVMMLLVGCVCVCVCVCVEMFISKGIDFFEVELTDKSEIEVSKC